MYKEVKREARPTLPAGKHSGALKDQYNARSLNCEDFHLKLNKKEVKRGTVDLNRNMWRLTK